MKCLRCGNSIKRGYEWNDLWQWKCTDCGFKWDSESPIKHTMSYLDDSGECTVHKIVPFGTLAVIKDEEV